MTPTNLRCEYFVNPLGIDAARPRLSWELSSPVRGARQAAYRVRVAGDPYTLSEGGADLWDSGRVESDQSIHVEYGGAPLRSGQRAWWTVEVWTDGNQDGSAATGPEPAFWEAGLLAPEDWTARWIGPAQVAPADAPPPALYLRKTLDLVVRSVRSASSSGRAERSGSVGRSGRAVRRARVYVTALGIYELFLNGQRIGLDRFRPGWTDYRHRVLYDVYDLTPLLQPGDGPHVLGATLADGWYSGHVAHLPRRHYGDRPAFLAQVAVEYDDGSTETIGTDETWRVTDAGPVRAADLLMGETYDARQELPGWDAPGFDDGAWKPATVLPAPTGVTLTARRGPAVRETQTLVPANPPVYLDNLPYSHVGYLFDVGENMVGVVRLRVRGPRGFTVRLRYGERLAADGTLYTANLRKARATDYYTLKGGGEETWEARFTFHGFQYVEVGVPADGPRLDAVPEVVGVVLHSDTPPTGSFECSDPLVNQLQRNIQRSQRGNFLEVPTDCPQRDERLGWTGDAQAFVGTAAFNMDVAAFFTKWQDDLADSQKPNGSIPPLVPHCCLGPDGGPAWADAVLICPWTMYVVYGDDRILREHYGTFTRFVDYLVDTSPGWLRCTEDSPEQHCFGDWLALDGSKDSLGSTPKGLIGTAFFAHSAWLLARIAAVLGRDSEIARYEALSREVRAAFQARYLTPEGEIVPEARTQTAAVLALYFHLLPEEGPSRGRVADGLVADIRARGNHLSTGFVGTPYINHVLTRSGHGDVAFALLHQTGWPSWLYAVTQGATSIWERWDGWTEEKGFRAWR